MYWYDVFLATVTGFFIGILFSWLKLPIPAPSALAGVMGIVGLFLGRYAYMEIATMLGRM
ncbi:XapX domain-containing protein [Parendozoicomonas haliclonae]|uniref:XapX domain protein n=1 Tax=Parendozoicomonas haliclonae TaxID=1960125 RepID=A0A1X7AHI7_9GAMM|nr:DUF1427 family protein [Parendozoicomonas haliclonae]SMA42916.1 hypothetical protein EHSB41UT_01525 [Parendozoicomonas haliclonae]